MLSFLREYNYSVNGNNNIQIIFDQCNMSKLKNLQ